MGRKQLPLISQHFFRHEKLGDSSNRYRHTCRSCGEDFPKGRNEVLIAHLVKRCPAISELDRQTAAEHLAGAGDARARNDQSGVSGLEHDLSMIPASLIHHATNPDHASPGFGQGGQSSMGPNSRSALEILGDVAAREGGRAGQVIAEQAPMFRTESPGAQLRQSLDFDDRNNLFAPQNSGAELLANVTMAPDQSMHPMSLPYHSQRALPMLSELSTRLPHGPYYSGASAGLAMTARAATELKAIFPPGSGPLPSPHTPAQVMLPGLSQNSQSLSSPNTAHLGLHTELPLSAGLASTYDKLPTIEIDRIIRDSMHQHIPPIPIQPTTPSNAMIEGDESMISAGGRSQRKRGRFSEPRRKEVQEVRKLGACLRCRILRKPCSGTETPCVTCKSIESARSWTIPCSRTRLADQLETFSTGFHETTLSNLMSGLQSDLTAISSTQAVEASLLITTAPDEILTIRIPTLGKTTGTFGEATDDPSQKLMVLDNTTEQLSETLSSSLLTANPLLITGHNMFMTSTLQLSMDRINRDNVKILRNAHELYWATNTLCHGSTHWDLYRAEVNNLGDARQRLEQESLSYSAIECQLDAAVAARATKVAADVAGDFERRVIGRSGTPWMETYLAAIILLSCLEKMVWFLSVHEQGHQSAAWPVEKSPAHYIASSFQFMELVVRSAMMRGVGTKLQVRLPKENGQPGTQKTILVSDSEEVEMRDWFNSFEFTSSQLMDLKIPTEPEEKVDPAQWEMRFIARLLLASVQT